MNAFPAIMAVIGLAVASSGGGGAPMRSLVDSSLRMPSLAQLWNVVTLTDYNTRVVVLGVGALGCAAGLIGAFLLLRKRSLLGDALSHATLPGVAGAFLLMSWLGGDGKWMPGLLAGAVVSGVLGVACILGIVHSSRIKEDAALGIVMSVFYGLGIVLLVAIQGLSIGHAAGLESFIYGKTASMLSSEAYAILLTMVVVGVACVLLLKEFAVLCFDQDFAAAQGWPVLLLDGVMMALVVAVTVIGLQAVGLIMIIALLIIPPAAARFWTDRLTTLLAIAAGLGGLSGVLGAALSALQPRLPAGATIVVVAGIFFLLSLLAGPRRGLIFTTLERLRLRERVARQNLLRTLYELSEPPRLEPSPSAPRPVPLRALLAARSWSPTEVRRALRRGASAGLVVPDKVGHAVTLTREGRAAAWREARNHRLWELFLIAHADVAPSHVDRDADEVEHVLGAELIAKLEIALRDRHPDLAAPQSPHLLFDVAPGASA